MEFWTALLLGLPAVFAAYNVREQHKRQWCSHFPTYNYVFTNNRWDRCQSIKPVNENHFGPFKKSVQLLRVAVAQVRLTLI